MLLLSEALLLLLLEAREGRERPVRLRPRGAGWPARCCSTSSRPGGSTSVPASWRRGGPGAGSSPALAATWQAIAARRPPRAAQALGRGRCRSALKPLKRTVAEGSCRRRPRRAAPQAAGRVPEHSLPGGRPGPGARAARASATSWSSAPSPTPTAPPCSACSSRWTSSRPLLPRRGPCRAISAKPRSHAPSRSPTTARSASRQAAVQQQVDGRSWSPRTAARLGRELRAPT